MRPTPGWRGDREGCRWTKNGVFSRAPPLPRNPLRERRFGASRRNYALFMHVHTCFYKENDTAQPNTDRLRRPWSKSAHTSLAHSSPRVAIQQGAPRRTGRQWPGGRFCSPGPPAARNLRCVGTKRKRVSLHACPRSAHGVHQVCIRLAAGGRKLRTCSLL